MVSNLKDKISISGNQMYSDQTKDLIHTVCKEHGLNEIEVNIVEMAIREACHNAIKYGTRFGKESFFDLKLSVNDMAVVAVITSRGKFIDFDHIKAFDIQNDFMAYKNGGLGIPLIKALMDEVHYERRADNINAITLIKYLKSNGKRRKVKR